MAVTVAEAIAGQLLTPLANAIRDERANTLEDVAQEIDKAAEYAQGEGTPEALYHAARTRLIAKSIRALAERELENKSAPG